MKNEMQRYAPFALLAASGICVAWTVALANPYAMSAAGLFFLLTYVMWRHGDSVMTVIFGFAGREEKIGNYSVVAQRDAIVRKESDRYTASAFAIGELAESLEDKPSSYVEAYSRNFERAITSLKLPVKFSMMVKPLDLSSNMEEIKTKRTQAELEKSRLLSENSNSPEIPRIERKISMWNRMLDRLAGGEKPMEARFYAMTSASGITQAEAVSKARSQLSQAMASISASMGLSMRHARGDDMLECFDSEFFVPAPAKPDFLGEEQ